VFFVVHREGGIGLCAGNCGEADGADGVEGTIFIRSVWEKNNSWSGHRAGSFLVRLKRSPPTGLCLPRYITTIHKLIDDGQNGGWAIRCVDESVFKITRGISMARQAHLEAAKLHLEAAGKHLDAAARYSEGNDDEAVRQSEEARAASRIADSKSTEAHGESKKIARKKLVWVGNSVAGRAVGNETKN
jgi:hypothetical protein